MNIEKRKVQLQKYMEGILSNKDTCDTKDVQEFLEISKVVRGFIKIFKHFFSILKKLIQL